MKTNNNLPIYLAMYKLQKYLYIIVKQYPKEYKYTLGNSILEKGQEILDYIIQANILTNKEKASIISSTSVVFDQLKIRLRMSYDLHLISHSRYAFIITQNKEIGNMLNGWLKWAEQN
jgi:hypothetical protein